MCHQDLRSLFQLKPIYYYVLPILSYRSVLLEFVKCPCEILVALIGVPPHTFVRGTSHVIIFIKPSLGRSLENQEKTYSRDYACVISLHRAFYISLIKKLVSSKCKHDLLYFLVVDLSPMAFAVDLQGFQRKSRCFLLFIFR